MKQTHQFLDMVQLHERYWGDKTYPYRPTLEQMLNAPVVTFWRPITENKKKLSETGYVVRLYPSLAEVEAYYTKMLLRLNIETPDYTIARIYFQQRRYVIKRIAMQFVEAK
jgi:hypothetical protein